MRVDFYHLTRGDAVSALPALAAKALATGQRMVIADSDPARLAALSQALWQAPGFLANGPADDSAANQPLLLCPDPGETAANGARLIALADGAWREAARAYDRVFLLFDDAGRDRARACWRQLDEADCERNYWVQDGSGWRQGP